MVIQTHKAQITTAASDILNFFIIIIFQKKIRLDISCEPSALFSLKKKNKTKKTALQLL